MNTQTGGLLHYICEILGISIILLSQIPQLQFMQNETPHIKMDIFKY